ncbi:type VI secretion system protein TssA [Humidesulfovibrio sp.]
MNLDAIGRTPLSGSLPAGQDPHYEPAFVHLQAEIDKLTSVSAGGLVDWVRVVDLAGEVLSVLAKDLSAAAYLGVGLTQTRGLEGLGLGARILNDIAVTFWEDCLPPKKRLRGRMAAFAWWQEKSLAWLKNAAAFDPLPAEKHGELVEAAQALDRTLGELLPDFPPMNDLVEVLRRLPVIEAGAPDAVSSGGQVSAPQAGGSPSAASPPAAPQDAKSARAFLAEAALDFVALAGREDPSDPFVWRAVRLGAWLKVRGLPPDEGGRTMIPPPEQAVKNALLGLLSQGRYLEAAQAAEEQVPSALFWLDPHRVTAKALEALGPAYAPALGWVCAEVRAFLAWLPGVEELTFSDGTPFADPETRAWLASLASTGAAGPARAEATGSWRDKLEKAREEAEKCFAEKDIAGALDLLGRAERRASVGSLRLRLVLAQISLLGRAGHWPVAVSLAEAAAGEVERRGLEDWDPDLALEALLAAREAYAGLGGEVGLAKAREFAACAARIRPSAALHLTG